MPTTPTPPPKDSVHFSGQCTSKSTNNPQVQELIRAHRDDDRTTINRILDPLSPQEQATLLVQAYKQSRHSNLLLITAIRRNNSEAITALINAGANVNERYNNGNRPLHYAALCRRSEAITALINAGANVNAHDNMGNTPIHWVAFRGLFEAITPLVNAGAKINLINNGGKTPLETMEPKLALTHFLLDSDSQEIPDRADLKDSQEILDGPDLKAAMLLLAHGANPDPLEPEARNIIYRYIQEQIQRKSTQLTDSTNPAEVKEAIQWLQLLPPGGGALSALKEWQTVTDRCNAFLNTKVSEIFQADGNDDQQNEILKRIQETRIQGFNNSLESVALKKILATAQEEEQRTDPK
jgi:hypothetical protein